MKHDFSPFIGDIWTTKNMTQSYLGITTAWFFPSCQHTQRALVSLCDFEFPHTVTRIRTSLNEILKEWDIPKAEVLTVITDNGTNTIAAFKRSQANINTETDEIISYNDSDNDDYEETDEGNVKGIDDKATENYRHFSCLPHTLQLVVKIALKSNQFSSTIKKVRKLVHSIKKSS